MTIITNTARPGETAEQAAARTAPRNVPSPFSDIELAGRHIKDMRRVVLESPFAGDIPGNVAYARACIRDSLLRGEAPIASHLLYTQDGILDDGHPHERAHGINAGHAWIFRAEAMVVYTDRGISSGMQAGIRTAEFNRVPIEYRTLGAISHETNDAK